MRKLTFVSCSLLILITAVLLFKFFKYQEDKPLALEPPKSNPITLEDCLNTISVKDCSEKINFLASDSLEGRMSGKKGNIEAAEFILETLKKAGLKTITQKFKITKTNPGPKNETGDDFTQNVYGWIEGSNLKDEIVVVGAHFDHIGYGPRYSRSNKIAVHNGADDNASGTVAVLEIAEAMSKLNPRRTVVFQFYSAEEMGLIGSRYYCENPLFPIESPDINKHVAMLNLDMVGHLSNGVYNASLPQTVLNIRDHVDSLVVKYSFAKKIISSGGGSDHVPFNNKRIPSMFLHTGSHNHYHTPTDDVETLDIDGISKIAKYAFELTWLLANEKKPDINSVEFKELPYGKDHDQENF